MPRILNEPLSRALVVESPHASLDDHLRQFGIESTWLDDVPDEAALVREINRTGAQVLFKRSRVPVTASLIAACPDLLAVQLCCIGDDSVDTAACAESGVLVFNDPVSNGRSVVELAIGHMIALSRRLYETDAQTRRGEWSKTAKDRYEVRGKKLGIVGLGNIGRQVARIAEMLGLDVRFHDVRDVALEVGGELGFEPTETLSELFRGSDIVSVHVSANDPWGNSNAGILDPHLRELGADRPTHSPRVFLNLARGNLHQTETLLAAVREGQIGRAAVDVFPEEPRPGQGAWSNPYAGEPRIMCTPHIGAATQEAQPRIAQRVASTIGHFSRYGWVRDCVFAPRVKLTIRDSLRGHTVLSVVHSVSRGTKKAIDDAIFEAGSSNLGSTHRDFDVGVAYDLSVIDAPLAPEQLQDLVDRASVIAGEPDAVRAVRQLVIPRTGW